MLIKSYPTHTHTQNIFEEIFLFILLTINIYFKKNNIHKVINMSRARLVKKAGGDRGHVFNMTETVNVMIHCFEALQSDCVSQII